MNFGINNAPLEWSNNNIREVKSPFVCSTNSIHLEAINFSCSTSIWNVCEVKIVIASASTL